MTDAEYEGPKLGDGIKNPSFRCMCGAAGGDLGDLETHILFDYEMNPGPHEPVDNKHWTPRMHEAIEKYQRKQAVLTALADAAGVTVEELKKALQG